MNLLVAHRGWSGKAPENTMASFRMAMDHPAVSWIELDVQLSKDGVPVVIHDFTLQRTTNGQGHVKDHTASELARLDAGSWFKSAFRGEKIPSLEQVLQAARGKVRLNIELKTANQMYPGIEQKVVSLVHAYHMQYDVCLTSFDHQAVRQVRALDSTIPTGLIMGSVPLLLKEQMEYAGAQLLSIDYRFLSAPFAVSVIEQGYGIMAWTVNDTKKIAEVAAMHPNLMICTNYPDRFAKAVKE